MRIYCWEIFCWRLRYLVLRRFGLGGMAMLSAANSMAPPVMRSSLEIMLDVIRQRDEQPQDVRPPALPFRPASRGRLPSFRRLSVNLESNPADERVFATETFGNDQLVRRRPDADPPVVPSPPPHDWMECKTTATLMEDYSMVEGARSEEAQSRRIRAQAHHQQQMKEEGATTLQSFIRGERARCNFKLMMERWRAAVVIQNHARMRFARTASRSMLLRIKLVQSVVRGRLARKHFSELKKLEASGSVGHPVQAEREVSKGSHLGLECDPEPARDPLEHTELRASDASQVAAGDEHEHSRSSHPSVPAELHDQMHETEAALREQIEENAILKQQLQEYETRWSAYELKMKSMEESWQKQLTSLQSSLAAARKNHLPEERMMTNPGVPKSTELAAAHTPEGTLAPAKSSDPCEEAAVMPIRNDDRTHNAVVFQLMKEFDYRRKVFDDEAGLLVGVKSGADDMNSYEELRRLKLRFSSWKKDYKMRLRDAKAKILKLLRPDQKRAARKKWWCSLP